MEMKFHIYRAESKISSQKFFDRTNLDENWKIKRMTRHQRSFSLFVDNRSRFNNYQYKYYQKGAIIEKFQTLNLGNGHIILKI